MKWKIVETGNDGYACIADESGDVICDGAFSNPEHPKLIAAAPDMKRNIYSTIGGLSLLLMAIEHEDPLSQLKLRVEDLLKENEQTLEGIE